MDCLLGNYMSNRISAFQKLFVHLFADLVLSSRVHLILIFYLLWPAYWKNGPHDAGAEKIIILIFSSKYFLYFFGETTICICVQLLRNFWSNSMTFQIFVNSVFIKRNQLDFESSLLRGCNLCLALIFCQQSSPSMLWKFSQGGCFSPTLPHYDLPWSHWLNCSPALPFLPPDYAKHVDKEPRHQQISFSHL